ncbi:TPA: HEPN domain-containing protein, partial [Streptococcus suis]
VVISFWNCRIKYVNSNEIHYLKVMSEQKQDIKECLLLLSFFTTIPLANFGYFFNESNEVFDERQNNNPSVIEWNERLAEIDRKMKHKANRKRRDDILSLMQMCSNGALHEYREHEEEQFFMYFKPIERVAKLVLDKNKILGGVSRKSRKKSTKTFLEHLLLTSFNNTVFDQVTLDELVGELNSVLENSLDRKNHRRIVLALSSITDNIDDSNQTKKELRRLKSNRIQQLVKIRNDIAHGNRVALTPDDLRDVEYLSRQMITLFFFGFNFECGYLQTKKFNNDFWSLRN